MTNDERKIRIFEEDPCGMNGFSSLYNEGETTENLSGTNNYIPQSLTPSLGYQGLEVFVHFQTW